MILKADPPLIYYTNCQIMDIAEKAKIQAKIQAFIKESNLYLVINLIALVLIIIAAVWLFLAFHLLAGSIYLMTFSFPLLLAGTFINWKRINKAKEKLRGI